MNVVLISPGYPPEMRHFTRGLTEVGARVIGIGDSPQHDLPADVRRNLFAYIQVGSLWNEDEMLGHLHAIAARLSIDRVECLWEPGVVLAAKLRRVLGLPGLEPERAIPFRDKEVMKQVLDRAGIRTPRHARVTSKAVAHEAADVIGFPVLIKPIAGAGAVDTYRCDDHGELEVALDVTRHVTELSVEEFVEGDEFTFDTICSGGEVQFYSVMWYRPRPLDGKLHEWISPQAIVLRNMDDPMLRDGIKMGFEVLDALGFRTGFTHMEWYRKVDGEVVFGEIGARPPGANAVEVMNFAHDMDLFRGWAEATCYGRFTQPVTKKYNCAIVFKRAIGNGRIQAIQGLDSILSRFGSQVVKVDLLPVGAPRRDWKQVQISDGYVILRHPELQETIGMADAVGTDLTLYAG